MTKAVITLEEEEEEGGQQQQQQQQEAAAAAAAADTAKGSITMQHWRQQAGGRRSCLSA